MYGICMDILMLTMMGGGQIPADGLDPRAVTVAVRDGTVERRGDNVCITPQGLNQLWLDKRLSQFSVAARENVEICQYLGGATAAEIASERGLTQVRDVRRALYALESLGMVTRQGTRPAVWHPTHAGRAMLQWQPLPDTGLLGTDSQCEILRILQSGRMAVRELCDRRRQDRANLMTTLRQLRRFGLATSDGDWWETTARGDEMVRILRILGLGSVRVATDKQLAILDTVVYERKIGVDALVAMYVAEGDYAANVRQTLATMREKRVIHLTENDVTPTRLGELCLRAIYEARGITVAA